MQNDKVVSFKPAPGDVVSTKLRTWNNKHPGNLLYTELIQKYVLNMPSVDDTDYYLRTSEKIIDIITNDRKGRFLKLLEGEKSCIIMNRKACQNKVICALRNAKSKLQPKAKGSRTSSAKATASTASTMATTSKSSIAVPITKKAKRAPPVETIQHSARRRQRQRRKHSHGNNTDEVSHGNNTDEAGSESPLFKYEAKQGDSLKINPYALELIAAVCNQQLASKSTKMNVLDRPGFNYTIENEPEKERRIRLQLRYRYFSAKATGMSPVEFSDRIMDMWGGNLVKIPYEEERAHVDEARLRKKMPYVDEISTEFKKSPTETETDESNKLNDDASSR